VGYSVQYNRTRRAGYPSRPARSPCSRSYRLGRGGVSLVSARRGSTKKGLNTRLGFSRDKRRDGHTGPTVKWADARRMWLGTQGGQELESVTKCCEVGAAANKHHHLAGPLIRGAAKSYLLKWICRGKRLTDGREEGRHPLSVSFLVTNRRRGGYFGLSFWLSGIFVSATDSTTPFFLTDKKLRLRNRRFRGLVQARWSSAPSGRKLDRPDSQVIGCGRGEN